MPYRGAFSIWRKISQFDISRQSNIRQAEAQGHGIMNKFKGSDPDPETQNVVGLIKNFVHIAGQINFTHHVVSY